jgi:hypothetical protein
VWSHSGRRFLGLTYEFAGESLIFAILCVDVRTCARNILVCDVNISQEFGSSLAELQQIMVQVYHSYAHICPRRNDLKQILLVTRIVSFGL